MDFLYGNIFAIMIEVSGKMDYYINLALPFVTILSNILVLNKGDLFPWKWKTRFRLTVENW